MQWPLTENTVGGPERPPSKRMIQQMKQEDQQRRAAQREGREVPESSGSQEGYLAYMSRQVQERTERLGIAGDNMERLEENSSNFANDVNKFVQSQKKKAVLGGELIVTTGLSKTPPYIVDADRSFSQCLVRSLAFRQLSPRATIPISIWLYLYSPFFSKRLEVIPCV